MTVPDELAALPLDCPEGLALLPAAGADLDISSRATCTDAREQRIEIAPPDIDRIAVIYDAGQDSAIRGQRMIALGRRDEVLAMLERAGYTIVTPPTWVVECRDKRGRWWIVSAHSRESAARDTQKALGAGPAPARFREIPA